MSKTFHTVLIVGGGLIGSSLARACMENNVVKRLIITDKDADVRSRLNALNIGHEVAESAQSVAAQADLIILAVPPGAMTQAFSDFADVIKPDCLISDVGSIKGKIIKDITPLLPKGVEFIGAHPIAGTENSGPEAGFASLFTDRWCVLTPADENSISAQKLKSFWEKMGSQIVFMDAQRHDLVLATTSHLPHLIAYALVGTATDMETVTRNEVVKYSAGGFRDFTRIAASDPVMWRDVFLGNRDAVLEVLGRYIEDLTALKKSIRWGEGDVLLKEFTKARSIRDRIVDAGQESATPNFGRDMQNDSSDTPDNKDG
ncbi:MAG: cyclohexadienyl dehydrogenase [Robiginitomaculum sp.]|nr:MAG: cyclohexadienyl dehydrogenase [Robiginitomaculum sp.]